MTTPVLRRLFYLKTHRPHRPTLKSIRLSLEPYKLHSKIVKVSAELLADGGPTVQKHVGTMLGRRLGRRAAVLCTTGTGVGEPTGILVDATVGVTTAAPTAFTYDDIADLRYSLNASYDEAGQWLMSPATLKAVRKIVDDASRPIFDGELLMGRPVVISDAMPAIAAESKPILFGDLRSYYMREVGDTAIRRYDETFAESGQIGLAVIHRIDGKLADVNGVAVLQMADA
jgi:HK97 family phage major capsid protein